MNTTFVTDELLLNDIDDDLDEDTDDGEVDEPDKVPAEPVEGDEGWPVDVPDEVPPVDE